MQIAEHYRQQIRDGELTEGTKLPAVKALAEEWAVSTATAAKGLSQLVVEGYVRTSPRGSFVDSPAKTGSTPSDRLDRVHRTGSVHSTGEHSRITAADIVTPPSYVADLLGLADDEQVVRREWVTIRAKAPAMLSVSWHPARYAELVPELLSKETSKSHDLITKIESALGLRVTRGRDDIEARETDQREAGLMGLPIGSPVLCVVHRWYDGDEVLEYAEHCIPPRQGIGYDYTVS